MSIERGAVRQAKCEKRDETRKRQVTSVVIDAIKRCNGLLKPVVVYSDVVSLRALSLQEIFGSPSEPPAVAAYRRPREDVDDVVAGRRCWSASSLAPAAGSIFTREQGVAVEGGGEG